MNGTHRPALVRHARYRYDEIRRQHQLLFPEGVLVLNESAAAIVRLCDGRDLDELMAALAEPLGDALTLARVREEVVEFLQRLAEKGLLRDA